MALRRHPKPLVKSTTRPGVFRGNTRAKAAQIDPGPVLGQHDRPVATCLWSILTAGNSLMRVSIVAMRAGGCRPRVAWISVASNRADGDRP